MARRIASDSYADMPVDQSEYGALRIEAMDDPGAARYCNRAAENFATAGLYAFRRRLDVEDVEIVEPEGNAGAPELVNMPPIASVPAENC